MTDELIKARQELMHEVRKERGIIKKAREEIDRLQDKVNEAMNRIKDLQLPGE